MFDFVRNFFHTEITPNYIVTKTTDGSWGIYDATGKLFRSYSRRRDAYRGAERAGLTVA